MLFDSHNHAFRVLGSVTQRGNFDHMRRGVNKVDRGITRGQCPLLGDGQPLHVRVTVLQFSIGLREWPDQEECAGHPLSALAAHAERTVPDGAEQMAGIAMPGTINAYPAWRATWLARHARTQRAPLRMEMTRPFDGFEYVKRVPPTGLVDLERQRAARRLP